MNQKHYNTIIIGGGIAGLFSAYNISKVSSQTFCVLEKNSKRWIGGRANNDEYYGTNIVTGAGIGRMHKDKILYDLANDLSIPTSTFTSNPNYSSLIKKVDVKKIINILRKVYKKYKPDNPNKNLIFSKFAKSILGEDLYKQFVITSGYSDYENADIYETLYHYGFEDNYCCYEGFSLSWKDLVDKLYQEIGPEHFKFNSMVIKITKIKSNPCTYSIETDKGVKYYSDKIIIGGTINTIRSLLPNYPIYNQIESQPFLRLYGKFSNNSIGIMKKYIKGYTVLPWPLQKIIPMNPDKGVYMIAYNDNKNTLLLKNHLANNEKNRELYCRFLEASLGIEKNTLQLISIKDYLWSVGTHYYKPLDSNKYPSREEFIKQAQHPEPNILVVGEVVSRDQGWVKGALESVKNVLDKKWIEM
jgi:hypothetical protein